MTDADKLTALRIVCDAVEQVADASPAIPPCIPIDCLRSILNGQ